MISLLRWRKSLDTSSAPQALTWETEHQQARQFAAKKFQTTAAYMADTFASWYMNEYKDREVKPKYPDAYRTWIRLVTG